MSRARVDNSEIPRILGLLENLSLSDVAHRMDYSGRLGAHSLRLFLQRNGIDTSIYNRGNHLKNAYIRRVEDGEPPAPRAKFETVTVTDGFGHKTEIQVLAPIATRIDPETGVTVKVYPPGYAMGAYPAKNFWGAA